jgi:hypothetical protein
VTHTHRLTAILILGLVIRLAWGLTRPADAAAIEMLPDQRGYLELGRNLLGGNGLHYTDPRFEGPLHAARTPGYPAFIAMCGGSIHAVRLVQALLDTSTALAIYLLTRKVTGNRFAPEIAAALVAFNPFLVYFSALLLTETLYTSMLAWGIVLLLHSRVWLGGAVLLALAIHVRPSGIGLPVLLAALVPMRPARKTLIAAALTALVVFPWAWRNHHVLGRWLWTTSNDGITAYDGLHPGATGKSDQGFVAGMPQVKEMSELERNDHFAAAMRQFVREHPGESFRLALVKVARTWSPVPLSEEFGRPIYRVIALLYALPLDVLAIVGMVSGGLSRRTIFFLLIPALYLTALTMLSVGSLRYRIPAEPMLAVLAGVGAARFIKKDRG